MLALMSVMCEEIFNQVFAFLLNTASHLKKNTVHEIPPSLFLSVTLDVIYMNRIALANLESDPIYNALYFCKRLVDFLTPPSHFSLWRLQ